MSKILGALCLTLGACAAGGGGKIDRETAPRAAARFEAATPPDTSQVFPAAQNPQLPSADRMHKVIRSELGAVASVDVRLCIAPDGHVQAVNLVRGSSLAAFDEAVLHDVADWQFAGMAGSSTFSSKLRTCEVATISYRPHE